MDEKKVIAEPRVALALVFVGGHTPGRFNESVTLPGVPCAGDEIDLIDIPMQQEVRFKVAWVRWKMRGHTEIGVQRA